MRHFTIFISLILLLGLGCRKPEESPTIYVHQAMLPYCWFPNGGYWVYQEVLTPGLIDSTYSYGTPLIGIIPDDYGNGFQSQSYDCGRFFRGRQGGQGIYARAYGQSLEFSYAVLTESYRDSSGEHRDEIFFWDEQRPDTLVSYPTTIIRQRMDSVIIQGKTYYDAIEVVTDPPSAAQHTYQVIWARGVGIVRRSMTDGTIWDLVRYHINN